MPMPTLRNPATNLEKGVGLERAAQVDEQEPGAAALVSV